PAYMDLNGYVIDTTKSQPTRTFPDQVQNKRRRVPSPLDLTPPASGSNKRKRLEDNSSPHDVAPEQHKRPRLQAHFHTADDIHACSTVPTLLTSYETMDAPIHEPSYTPFQPEFLPYDTLMSCYT